MADVIAVCDDLRLNKLWAMHTRGRPSYAEQEELYITFGLLAALLKKAQKTLCRDVYVRVTSTADREFDCDDTDSAAS